MQENLRGKIKRSLEYPPNNKAMIYEIFEMRNHIKNTYSVFVFFSLVFQYLKYADFHIFLTKLL